MLRRSWISIAELWLHARDGWTCISCIGRSRPKSRESLRDGRMFLGLNESMWTSAEAVLRILHRYFAGELPTTANGEGFFLDSSLPFGNPIGGSGRGGPFELSCQMR